LICAVWTLRESRVKAVTGGGPALSPRASRSQHEWAVRGGGTGLAAAA